jgi:hypothetical protein
MIRYIVKEISIYIFRKKVILNFGKEKLLEMIPRLCTAKKMMIKINSLK